jgi:MFS family permease
MARGDSPAADAGRRSSGRPLLFIFLTVFIDLLGFGIVIPLLPIYSKVYHADELTLGLLMGSFSGMQLLFAPLWGRLSDRIGRKPVLVGGLIGTSLSYLLFSRADSLALLFASRLLAGFFGANVSTAQAYIADVTTPESRAKGMGLVGAAFGLGFTLGPWMGGELARAGQGVPGLVAAGFSLAAAAFGALTLREPARGARGADSRLFRLDNLRFAAREARLRTPLLLAFLAVLAFSGFESMFQRFGIELFPAAFQFGGGEEVGAWRPDEAAALSGRYLGAVGVISALIQGGLIRRLVPRFGEPALAVAGPALTAVGLAVVAAAPSFAVVIAGCIVMPLGFGVNNPAVSSLISRSAPAAEQGAYMGINQSLASLARLVGPLMAGAVYGSLGARWPFAVSVAVLVGATGMAVGYRRRFGASFGRG